MSRKGGVSAENQQKPGMLREHRREPAEAFHERA
jgi:hypothetical protein